MCVPVSACVSNSLMSLAVQPAEGDSSAAGAALIVTLFSVCDVLNHEE